MFKIYRHNTMCFVNVVSFKDLLRKKKKRKKSSVACFMFCLHYTRKVNYSYSTFRNTIKLMQVKNSPSLSKPPPVYEKHKIINKEHS